MFFALLPFFAFLSNKSLTLKKISFIHFIQPTNNLLSKSFQQFSIIISIFISHMHLSIILHFIVVLLNFNPKKSKHEFIIIKHSGNKKPGNSVYTTQHSLYEFIC